MFAIDFVHIVWSPVLGSLLQEPLRRSDVHPAEHQTTPTKRVDEVWRGHSERGGEAYRTN